MTSALGLFAVACTLTTSLDGLIGDGPVGVGTSSGNGMVPDAASDDATSPGSGGADAATDGGSTTPGSDAGVDAGPSKYAAAVLVDSPVGYWRLGEASGSVAKDEKGARQGAFNGTIQLGAPGALAGDPNKAAVLTGSTSHIALGDAFAFNGTAAFSIEMWVKPTIVDTTVRWLAVRSTNAAQRSGYALYFATDFVLFHRTSNGTDSAFASYEGTLSTTKFTHLVATSSGTTTKLYVDGVLTGQASNGLAIDSTGGAFVFGSAPFSATSFSGTLDELAVYDKALTDARVKAHFDAAK